MSDTVLVALIGLVGNGFVAWLAYLTRRDVRDVKKHTNSIVTELVAQAEVVGHAAGVAQEQSDVRARTGGS